MIFHVPWHRSVTEAGVSDRVCQRKVITSKSMLTAMGVPSMNLHWLVGKWRAAMGMPCCQVEEPTAGGSWEAAIGLPPLH